MEDFLKEMADILDEDAVKETDRLHDFPSWDSLAILSVISMAGERYGGVFSAQQIKSAATVRDLFDLISKGNALGTPG